MIYKQEFLDNKCSKYTYYSQFVDKHTRKHVIDYLGYDRIKRDICKRHEETGYIPDSLFQVLAPLPLALPFSHFKDVASPTAYLEIAKVAAWQVYNHK